MLPLTLAVLSLTADFPHTTNFLKRLAEEEKPDYINIIRLDNCSKSLTDLANAFEQPKTIIDVTSWQISKKGDIFKHIGYDYLNFPKLADLFTLKFYFNRNFLTVILFENVEKLLDIMNKVLTFSGLSTIVIIMKYDPPFIDMIMAVCHANNFRNVLFLNIDSFEANQLFMTYESYPNYQKSLSRTFKKEKVRNIRGNEVTVALANNLPFCFRSNVKDEYVASDFTGILLNFYKTFIIFINGTYTGILEARTDFHMLYDYDFVAALNIIPRKLFFIDYPVLTETVSDDIDFNDLIVIVPKAKPTKMELYLVKIFSLEIWILTFIFVFFASGAFALQQRIAKKKVTFWRVFGQIFRCTLEQSFPWPPTYDLTSIFYCICIWFGFMLISWFNAILGSFVTSTLYDKQVLSLEDLKKYNIKIGLNATFSVENLERYKDIEDLMVYHADSHYLEVGEQAAIMSDFSWDHVIVPLKRKMKQARDYVKSDIIIEKLHLRAFHRHNSPYQERINRFIGLIKDRGLFKYWCALNPKDHSDKILSGVPPVYEEDPIKVLQLDFFLYPFCIWGAGLILSFIVFLYEIRGYRRIFYI